jgi:hypothetical protein
VRGRRLSLIGGVYLSSDAGGRGLAGLSWAEWAAFGFLFLWNFNAFSFLFSLWVSNRIQTKFQIQTNSNMCINSKNNLGSA